MHMCRLARASVAIIHEILMQMKAQTKINKVHTGKFVKFKDFSRTSKSLSKSFQGLKVNQKYWSKCYSTSEVLD